MTLVLLQPGLGSSSFASKEVLAQIVFQILETRDPGFRIDVAAPPLPERARPDFSPIR